MAQCGGCTAVILALRELMQEDCKFKANLGYTMGLRLGWTAQLDSSVKMKQNKQESTHGEYKFLR